jgi:hypothetical protein
MSDIKSRAAYVWVLRAAELTCLHSPGPAGANSDPKHNGLTDQLRRQDTDGPGALTALIMVHHDVALSCEAHAAYAR